MKVLRGEIYMVDLTPTIGSEQSGCRPVLVIQNNVGNRYSPTIIVAAITSQINKALMPTHVELATELSRPSIVLLEQLRTLDKRRLKEKLTTLSREKMKEIDKAILISLGCVKGLKEI